MFPDEMANGAQECLGVAEFDQFARDYTAGMENPVKALVGRSADDFIIPKVRWLLRDQKTRPLKIGSCRKLLDLGCGAGRFLWHLQELGFSGELFGLEVSRGMLAELTRIWRKKPFPELKLSEQGNQIPFKNGTFDIVVVSAVVHHVLPTTHLELFREVFRVLSPGGRIYVFEHNPYHPVTRWVVQHTATDDKAVLVAPARLRAGLRATEFRDILARYLLFLPPRWRWTWHLDDWLGWLPAGGQYVMTGCKAM